MISYSLGKREGHSALFAFSRKGRKFITTRTVHEGCQFFTRAINFLRGRSVIHEGGQFFTEGGQFPRRWLNVHDENTEKVFGGLL